MALTSSSLLSILMTSGVKYMQLDGELVAVPVWLRQVANHYGIPLCDLLDITKLEKYLSKDDLINYVVANKLLSETTFTNGSHLISNAIYPYVETLRPVNLMERVSSTASADSRIDKMLKDIEVNSSVFLNNLADVSDGRADTKMVELLATKLVTQDEPQVELSNYVLDIFEIKDCVFGLSVRPRDNVDLNVELERSLRVLNRQYKYEDVCQTELFRYWCEYFSTGN